MTDLALTSAGRFDKGADRVTQAKQAAQQFENIFIQQILKEANKTRETMGGDLFDSSALNQFQDMLHQGLGEHMAGHIGLADVILRQLGVSEAHMAMPSSSVVNAAQKNIQDEE